MVLDKRKYRIGIFTELCLTHTRIIAYVPPTSGRDEGGGTRARRENGTVAPAAYTMYHYLYHYAEGPSTKRI